jgi:hypothetical protein
MPRKLIVVDIVPFRSLFNGLVKLEYQSSNHIIITQIDCMSLRHACLYVTVSFKEDERQVAVP